MTENRKEILITSILLLIFAGLLFLNYISYKEFQKTTLKRIERHEALEALQEEKLAARQKTTEFIRLRELARDQEIKDILEFNEEYSSIEREFTSSINSISFSTTR